MLTFLVRRLLHTLLVALGVTLLVFVLVHLIPGDPVLVILGTDATPEELERLRKLLGLDQPLPAQYASYLALLLRGELGESIFQHRPVAALIGDRFPATVELASAAIVVAIAIGGASGIVAALRPYSLFDAAATFLALAGVAMPVFWLAMLAILAFSLSLGWLPSFGRGEGVGPSLGLVLARGDLEPLGASLRHLVLPAVTLGAFSAALISRLVRSSMLEVLGQDYVRTAHAKGLRERRVVLRHALPNALIPVVTAIGLQVGALLGGAVIAETIFAWPGIGRLLIQAISQRDYPLVQGIVLVSALLVSLINLLVDLAYAALNPKIRYA